MHKPPQHKPPNTTHGVLHDPCANPPAQPLLQYLPKSPGEKPGEHFLVQLFVQFLSKTIRIIFLVQVLVLWSGGIPRPHPVDKPRPQISSRFLTAHNNCPTQRTTQGPEQHWPPVVSLCAAAAPFQSHKGEAFVWHRMVKLRGKIPHACGTACRVLPLGHRRKKTPWSTSFLTGVTTVLSPWAAKCIESMFVVIVQCHVFA